LCHPRLYPRVCGHFGDRKRECRFSPKQAENYRNKISGPLLDRIDIHAEAPAVEYKELSSTERAEPSTAIRDRIIAAREIQQARLFESRRAGPMPRCPTTC
jgi:magnesium chelatase family protein